MRQLDAFTGQNWLITPAALAFNEAPPQDIYDQKWLLVLTGSLYANFWGTDFDEVPDVKSGQFNPDIASPCNWAISQYAIARPPGVEGTDYFVNFQVENWAPFVSLGGLVDEDSDWAQTEVINWQPGPFLSETDALNGTSVGNIFNGVVVNCTAADSDARLTLIGYNITLVGKIVFTKIIIF
jgi:hypothetical protein